MICLGVVWFAASRTYARGGWCASGGARVLLSSSQPLDRPPSVSGYLPFVSTNRAEVAWGVLGDPSRREILTALADTPMPVGELANRLPISRPAVSQHLKLLKDAGVVTDEERGTRRVYSVDHVALTAMRDQLDVFWNRTLTAFADMTNAPASSGGAEGATR